MKKFIFTGIIFVVLNCGGETPPPQPSATPIPSTSPGQTPVPPPPPSSTPNPTASPPIPLQYTCTQLGQFLACAADSAKKGVGEGVIPTQPPSDVNQCNTLAQQYKDRFPSCANHLP